MRIQGQLAGVVLAFSALVGLSCSTSVVAAVSKPATIAGACGNCGAIVGNVSESGSGNALAGVAVIFQRRDFGVPPVVVATDALGQYVSGAQLSPGEYSVYTDSADHIDELHDNVRCAGFCDVALGTAVVVTTGNTRVINFALDVGAAIRGTIVMPVPQAGVQVVLTNAATLVPTTVDAAADGSYDTGNVLVPGSYYLRTSNNLGLVDKIWPGVDCPGGACIDDAGSPIVVTEGATVDQINLFLTNGATLSGRVTRASDDAPLTNAFVTIARADGSNAIPRFTGFDGTYALHAGLPPGEWRVHANPQPDQGLLGETWQDLPCVACSSGPFTAIAIADETPVTGIELVLDPPSHVAGRITDIESGLAVEGARVEFLDSVAFHLIADATTAADGTYTSADLPPGSFVMRASGAGYRAAIYGAAGCEPDCEPADGALIDLGMEETVFGIDLALTPGASIAGTITRGGGLPQSFEPVLLLTPSLDLIEFAITDIDGGFQFSGLDAGSYVVMAQETGDYIATLWPDIECALYCGDGHPPLVMLAAREARTGIDIAAILGGYVRGEVSADVGGAALAGVRISVIEPHTNLFAGSGQTDIAGDYRIGPLLAGQYVVRTRNTLGYMDEAFDDHLCSFFCGDIGDPVALAAGQTVEADFGLAIGGRIGGRITAAATGLPLANFAAGAVVTRTDGTVVDAPSVTDGDGGYLTSGLPAGTYYVRSENTLGFIEQQYEHGSCFWCVPLQATPVDVSLGATSGGIDFALLPGARLRGSVTTQGGGPPIPFFALALHGEQGRFMFRIDGQDGVYESPAGLAPGTYYLRTTLFGRYRDELLGGLPCVGACDVRRGTPIVVGDDDIGGLDFEVEPVLFVDGFEALAR
jgi:hypothetical protein